MKRLLITFTLLLSLISLNSFANEVNVSNAALQSFKSSFKTAKEVKWSTTANYYKADFSFNGQYVSAFYDAEGKMIAMTRNVSSFQIPLSLQSSLKEKYEQFWISELIEVANEEGTSYYVTIENADTKITLQSTSNSEWKAYKKQSKS